jgi:hypothetical protein
VARIVVVGNCQADGVAACLRRLTPGHKVQNYSWAQTDVPDMPGGISAAIRAADILVRQQTPLKAPSWAQELERRTDAVVIPRIAFSGLQPDWIGLHGADVRSRLGRNYSVLAIAAMRLKVPIGQAADLFNAYIYERLGFFREYASSRDFMLKQRCHIAPDIDGWSRYGAFLHLPNHPVIEVIWSISQDLCRHLGIEAADAEPPPDPLARFARWPVYPEIAKRLGFEGSTAFKPPGSDDRLDLDQMIAETYLSLAAVGPGFPWPPSIEQAMQTLRAEGF